MANNNSQTLELITDTLHKLRCQTEIIEDGCLATNYQGERFAICYADDCAVIDICDVGWYRQPNDDIEAVANIKRAINEVNIYSMAKLFYTNDEEIIVYTRRHAIFIKEIPQLDQYLASLFNSIFNANRNFILELGPGKRKAL